MCALFHMRVKQIFCLFHCELPAGHKGAFATIIHGGEKFNLYFVFWDSSIGYRLSRLVSLLRRYELAFNKALFDLLEWTQT